MSALDPIVLPGRARDAPDGELPPVPGDVDRALAEAGSLAAALPLPGEGRTAELWGWLATTGAGDLGAVRAIEPHLDAVAILRQAGRIDLPHAAERPDCAWGVFAAEGGEPLRAREGGGWRLDGVKPWCSLAGRLDAALITATLPDGARQLFAIDLHDPGVERDDAAWHARGLAEVPSGPIGLHDVPAWPVGEPGWYLERRGFLWGGLGVAACWAGGLIALARTIREAVQRRPERDLTAMHLGALDERVHTVLLALGDAADRVDRGLVDGDTGRLLTKRVRATTAAACEEAILRAGHALGPAPLAQDATHAKRVGDLQLYIRQHHAEADLASLGRLSARTLDW